MERALIVWNWGDGNQIDFDVRMLYNVIPEIEENRSVFPVDAISYVRLEETELTIAFEQPLSILKLEKAEIEITSTVSYKIRDSIATYLRTRKQVEELMDHGIKVSIK